MELVGADLSCRGIYWEINEERLGEEYFVKIHTLEEFRIIKFCYRSSGERRRIKLMTEPTLGNFWDCIKSGAAAETKITVMKQADGTTVLDKEQVKQVFYQEFKERWLFIVIYHVTIVANGHGLLKKCWPFGTRLRSTHCREFNYLKLCRPAYFIRTTQLLPHPGHE